MQHKYGTPHPTVDDVLATPRMQRFQGRLHKQLSMPRSALLAGDVDICDENTPRDIDTYLHKLAQHQLKWERTPSPSTIDTVALLTNGTFAQPEEFLRELYAHHISLQISLDSFNGHRLNENRGRQGVFGKVKRLVGISRALGGHLGVQAHGLGGATTRRERENVSYFEKNAHLSVADGMLQMGNAVQNGFGPGEHAHKAMIGDLDPDKPVNEGWCTGFTRPKDLHLRPNGNVGNCLYAYANPEEFGNVRERPIAAIVNGLGGSNISRMFSDGRIARYQHELDPTLFPEVFHSSCELIAITATYGTIKEALEHEGHADPRREANRRVTALYKYTLETKK